MKLSEKGCSKLGKVFQGCPLPPHILPRLIGCEFDPDDFEGDHFNRKDKKVVLTVEEAKRLHDCAMFFWDDYEGTKLFTYDDERFLTDMKKRIEGVEKCYE